MFKIKSKGMLKCMEIQHTPPNIQIPFEFLYSHVKGTCSAHTGSASSFLSRNISPICNEPIGLMWIVCDVVKVHE